MSTVKAEIAKNLLFYRKQSGFTQKELAERIGVKHNAISSWEKATNSIDMDTLFQICEIFNVSVTDMFGVFGRSDLILNAEDNELFKKYRALNEQTKNIVKNIIDTEYERISDSGKSKGLA